jgi:hypothetical protein
MREKEFVLKEATPVLFVSVAAKGFSLTVSLLFATLARRSISVASKGLRGSIAWGRWGHLQDCWKVGMFEG